MPLTLGFFLETDNVECDSVEEDMEEERGRGEDGGRRELDAGCVGRGDLKPRFQNVWPLQGRCPRLVKKSFERIVVLVPACIHSDSHGHTHTNTHTHTHTHTDTHTHTHMHQYCAHVKV